MTSAITFPAWVIGLMSGTSMDGVDAALLFTDGEHVARPGASLTLPYDETLRRDTLALMRGQGDKKKIARAITERHREAVEALIQQSGLARAEIALIGFHGQTIRHMPHEGITEQIGDAGWLAQQTGIAVVADFRSNDVKHGGQGAPLVPLYHAALAHALPRPVMVVNIGGVANVTWIGEKEESRVESRESSNLPLPSRGRVREGGGEESAELAAPPSTFAKASVDKPNLPRKGGGISVIAATFPLDSRLSTLDSSLLAFDCGPGNALIDDWMRRHTGAAHDENGQTAARGTVDAARVAAFLGDEFFHRPAPKSLDRHHFSLDLVAGLSLADGAATLTAMTAAAIAASARQVPAPPRQWLITGGGRHNATLMRMVQEEVATKIIPVESVGWNGDALEAEAFAYLAARSVKKLPLTLASTTGVSQPVTGGVFYPVSGAGAT